MFDDLELTEGLTLWGVDIGAQIRRYATLVPDTTQVDGEQTVLALHVKDTTQISPEDGHPYLISASDCERLRDLLDYATDHGYLPPRSRVIERCECGGQRCEARGCRHRATYPGTPREREDHSELLQDAYEHRTGDD